MIYFLICVFFLRPKNRDSALTQQGQHHLLPSFSFLFFSPPLASQGPTPPLCHPSCLHCTGDAMPRTTRLQAAGSSKSGRGFLQPRLATLGSIRRHWHACCKAACCKRCIQGSGGGKPGGYLARVTAFGSHLVEQEVVQKLTLKIPSQR